MRGVQQRPIQEKWGAQTYFFGLHGAGGHNAETSVPVIDGNKKQIGRERAARMKLSAPVCVHAHADKTAGSVSFFFVSRGGCACLGTAGCVPPAV